MSQKNRENGRKRGKNYYAEPEYKVPDEIPLSVVLLSLIAKHEWASYKQLMEDWVKFVPHEKAYHMMGKIIRQLKGVGFIKKRKEGRTVYVQATKHGIRKVIWFDEKYGIPEVLKEPIAEKLEAVKRELEEKKKAEEEYEGVSTWVR